MIKKIIFVAASAATLAVNAQDFSTIVNTVDIYSKTNWNGSAKYMGMAGSIGALGGDYSALNSNPAGIGVNIASDISVSLNILNSKNQSSIGKNTSSFKINDTDLGNAGGILVFPLAETSKWKFINLAFNYSSEIPDNYVLSPGNQNINFDIYNADGNVIDNIAYRNHQYSRYGNLSKMSFGVGSNYDNRIYLGLGLNFFGSTISQEDVASFNSTTTNNWNYYDKQYTPFTESSTGFSATVGAIAKVTQNFRVGAALETPTWWDMTREFNYYESPNDGYGAEDRRITTPLKATLSAAYVASKNFALNVDYSLGLSKPTYKVYGDAETELNNFFDDNYKNLSEVKIGAEYRLAGLRVRGGYSFASNPFDTTNLNSFDNAGNAASRSFDNLFIGKRNTLAFGLGYDFKSFYVDAAYQNLKTEYSNPFLQGFADYNSGYFSNNYIVESDAAAVSTVKNTRDNFFVTVGWKF